MLTVLLVGDGIQQWASAERETNLRQQTQATVEAMQNNLGPSVSFNLEKHQTLPEQLVVPELQARFAAATNDRHKFSLAIALAGYGELDAEYLVSRIDEIAEADTRNYVTALQVNSTTAVAALKAEALKCIDNRCINNRSTCFCDLRNTKSRGNGGQFCVLGKSLSSSDLLGTHATERSRHLNARTCENDEMLSR